MKNLYQNQDDQASQNLQYIYSQIEEDQKEAIIRKYCTIYSNCITYIKSIKKNQKDTIPFSIDEFENLHSNDIISIINDLKRDGSVQNNSTIDLNSKLQDILQRRSQQLAPFTSHISFCLDAYFEHVISLDDETHIALPLLEKNFEVYLKDINLTSKNSGYNLLGKKTNKQYKPNELQDWFKNCSDPEVLMDAEQFLQNMINDNQNLPPNSSLIQKFTELQKSLSTKRETLYKEKFLKTNSNTNNKSIKDIATHAANKGNVTPEDISRTKNSISRGINKENQPIIDDFDDFPTNL